VTARVISRVPGVAHREAVRCRAGAQQAQGMGRGSAEQRFALPR